MDKIYLKKYAQLVIEVGINLYKDQCLIINTGLGTYEFALLLAETAYKKGAKFVEIALYDNRLTRIRSECSSDRNLPFVPQYAVYKSDYRVTNDWAAIFIDNTEELDVLKGTDPEKLQKMAKAGSRAVNREFKERLELKHAWCVIAGPGPRWAAKVFNVKPTPTATDRLWKKIIPILRLNSSDPTRRWLEHNKRLIQRKQKLNKLRLDKLLFTGPETHLEIGLSPAARWDGGCASTPGGRMFLPNIPTEEVATTPDLRRTAGYVKVTRPVSILGTIVHEAWLRFEKGKVVEYKASKGKDILEKLLDVDQGARYLGEVALVDKNSPVNRSGLLFYSMLYDENAFSHIALGSGFSIALKDGRRLKTDNQKRKAGCNVSLVHCDLMIGSPETEVIGTGRDGKETTIIRNGEFAL